VTAPRTCDCGGCPECLSTVRLNAIRAAQSAKEAAAEGLARALSALLERMAFEGGEGPWAIEPRAALAAWEKWKKVEKKAEEKAEKTKGGNRCR